MARKYEQFINHMTTTKQTRLLHTNREQQGGNIETHHGHEGEDTHDGLRGRVIELEKKLSNL